ncbi:hypothetical protein GQX73_g4385 [Xylaria multiplex]|uniref:Uncharacterized protein n=1 Tax=Xylaria multiplex TaxID=323545 RepID=A0A7C8ISH4_9PEZI|nr:hypothetical protein GQX73_g4385 [Xylaria multiplex]
MKETVESLRKRVKDMFNHRGNVKMQFPGIMGELNDTDIVQERIVARSLNAAGATLTVELLSDTEDGEPMPLKSTAMNDLSLNENHATQAAKQDNFIAGMEDSRRPTKAVVTRNKAEDNAIQRNGVLSAEMFRAFLSAGQGRST